MKPLLLSTLALFGLAGLASCDAGKSSSKPSSTGTSSTAASSSAGTSSSSGAGGAGGQGTSGTGGGASLPGWTLVWSDDFDGPDGSAVDPTKWVYGGTQDGQYNQELEYYNPTTGNVFVAGGDLHLVAKALPAGGGGLSCWNGPCQYTSGKITTKASGKPSLFEKQYGRFSARMKIPAGQGMWPAFWLLGNNIDSVSWPTCGEVDIMENIGKAPATDYGTLHGPNGTQEANLGGNVALAMGALSDDFHVYSIEWKAGQIAFLLDDMVYFTGTKAQFPGTWVFDDHPFYIILNLAIGGSWPGSPDTSTQFPAELLVDWVRVYDPAP
jgi:beta-glucanase (GH16 family)